MAVITKQKVLNSFRSHDWRSVAVAAGLALFALLVGREAGWWIVAVIGITAFESWYNRTGLSSRRADGWVRVVLPVLTGIAAVVVIALNIRLATQIGVAVLYGLWRWWWSRRLESAHLLGHLLISQAAWFEALFLAAAVWRIPEWIVMGLAWLGTQTSVSAVLRARGERFGGILAAAWALAVVEIAWVLLLWLFTYASPGGYVLVPQPALILVALAYCYGSIYASARNNNLSRSRLFEYLAIGLILIIMVMTGTSWRGSV